MKILKFKQTDTEFDLELPISVPETAIYVISDTFYTVYEGYDRSGGINFAFDGPYQSYLKVYFWDDTASIEESNTLTDATIKAMTAKPGNGIVDMLSLKEFKDAGVTIEYCNIKSNFPF